MARLLVITVGTSLFTNRDDRPWKGWNGRAGNPLPDETEVDRWLEVADPILVSAENQHLAEYRNRGCGSCAAAAFGHS